MIQALRVPLDVPTRTIALAVYIGLLKAYNLSAGPTTETACESLMVGCGSGAAERTSETEGERIAEGIIN